MGVDREQRDFQRFGCRIRCQLHIDGKDLAGFVTDLSASGLFVQASQKLSPGAKVIVTLHTDAGAPLVLTGAVARERHVHPGATSVVRPGVGIVLESAPEPYFQLLMDLHGD